MLNAARCSHTEEKEFTQGWFKNVVCKYESINLTLTSKASLALDIFEEFKNKNFVVLFSYVNATL